MKDQEINITLEEALNEFDASQDGFSESEAYHNAEQRDIAIGVATPRPSALCWLKLAFRGFMFLQLWIG